MTSGEYLWDPAAESDPEIAALERSLQRFRYQPVPFVAPKRRVRLPRMHRALLAAAAMFLVLAGLQTAWFNRAKSPWSIVVDGGTATIGARVAVNGDRLAVGEQLVTDASSSARIAVGHIGDVQIGASSAVKVVSDGEGGHTLALERGEMHARIWAPPRFFVVQTPHVTATDLGCIYTMRVDSRGAGTLDVQFGAVELQQAAERVFVPAGVSVRFTGSSPLIPVPMRASPSFRMALDAVLAQPDSPITSAAVPAQPDSSIALDTLLAQTDAQSTITLWHLLPRVPVEQRRVIVGRIHTLVPLSPNAYAQRELVVQLDAGARASWEIELRPAWSTEPDSKWRRFLVRWRLAKPLIVLQLAQEQT